MSNSQPLIWGNKAFHFYYNLPKVKFHETLHAHAPMEIVYIHSGTGKIAVNGKTYPIHNRTFAIFKPFQLHQVRLDVPYSRSVMIIHNPIPSVFSYAFPSISDFLYRLMNHHMEDQVFSVDDQLDQELSDHYYKFQEILKIVPAAEQEEHFLTFWLRLLTIIKYRFKPNFLADNETRSLRNQVYLEKVTNWIEAHFREPIGLEELADKVHITPNYLSNLFRRQYGITLSEYIRKRRLDEACLLLKATSLSADEIGHAVGFKNNSYFFRCFKKHIGMSPQQYRLG